MEIADNRRSDRISITFSVQVSGNDLNGKEFNDKGRTLVVSRHGATILLNQRLATNDQVTVRCLATGREAVARVVGQTGEESGGYIYGMAFVAPKVNVWNIYFPPRDESDKATGHALMECSGCGTRQVILLDELEIEVFEANRHLSRRCQRCHQYTIWKETLHEPARDREEAPSGREEPPKPTPAPERRTRNERKYVRLNTRLKACIRHAGLGEEVVTSENVSRGGICFKSRRVYFEGSRIEVAIPYAEGVANIFIPARIVRAQDLPAEGLCAYGVEYLKAQAVPPQK